MTDRERSYAARAIATDEMVEAALREWSKPNDRREASDIMRAALEAALKAKKAPAVSVDLRERGARAMFTGRFPNGDPDEMHYHYRMYGVDHFNAGWKWYEDDAEAALSDILRDHVIVSTELLERELSKAQELRPGAYWTIHSMDNFADLRAALAAAEPVAR